MLNIFCLGTKYLRTKWKNYKAILKDSNRKFFERDARVFRALNLGTSGELLEIEVRRILFGCI